VCVLDFRGAGLCFGARFCIEANFEARKERAKILGTDLCYSNTITNVLLQLLNTIKKIHGDVEQHYDVDETQKKKL